MHAMNRAGQRLLMALFWGMLMQPLDTGILAQTPQGLVSHYSFDTPGQPEHDGIGGNHGVAVVAVTQVPGLKGLAASFSNGWIDLPSSVDFDLLGGDFTLSLFINVPPGTDNRNWFTKATTSTHEYGLGGGATLTNGTVGIGFAGGPGGGAVSVSQPFDGQWHHIAGIKRGNQAEIWVDGILEGTGALNVSVVTDIGQFAIGRDGACCEFFNGLMDEAKIWSKALSASEIAAEIHGGATVWIGLKNGDDQGTQFDLRTEAFINNVLVSSGETRCITNVTRNPNLAKEAIVPFGSVSGGVPSSGDLFSFRILTRIGTNPDDTKCSGPGGSHNNAVGLRLHFDSITRPSRLSGQVVPDPAAELFLHALGGNLFLDSNAQLMGTAKFKDSSSINFANGNPWKEIGTWTMTLP